MEQISAKIIDILRDSLPECTVESLYPNESGNDLKKYLLLLYVVAELSISFIFLNYPIYAIISRADDKLSINTQ